VTLVNTATGEVIEPRALAPVNKDAASVVAVLENAKTWLSTAVEMTGPEEIAAAKAHIRTAEVYARELHLSKEIQLDAAEMVRRAEYALGKSIRKGQEEGTIRTKGQRGPQSDYTREREGRVERVAGAAINGTCLPGVKDIAPDFYANGSEIALLSSGVNDEQFEKALSEAKSEGNLTRANVVRKVKKNAPPATRDDRADLIADLATQGYTSRQMAPKVGVIDARVREIARSYGIEINADKVVGKTRRIDHTAAVESAVTELDNWASSLTFIDFTEVDFTEADEWVASLSNSLTELRRFIKQIKETTHV
jgi:hypothetical protein